MKGFFNPSQLSVANNLPTIPRCGLCKLYRSCHSPRMKVTGEGRKGVLIVAEAPGQQEDLKGVQLIGESGQLLRRILKSIGISLDRDCWKTNALICRPPNNKLPKNPKPLIDACRPNLMNAIKELKPHTIILLGKTAVSSLTPVIWKDKVDEFGRWVGWNIPSQKLNCWVCPTWHPSYLLRQNNTLLEMLTRKHLKKAFSHKTRPWEIVPDYKEQVEIINRPSEASLILKEMQEQKKPVSLDLETNCIKPEEEGAEIVCCSVSQEGERTIAYPWSGSAIDGTLDLIKSGVPIRGANIKFEERWFKRLYNTNVKNWQWDSVIAAHCADNRAGVSGVKFQSFVLLGMESYNTEIEPFLKSAKGKRLNRIKELPISDVMLYCGLDSIVEWKISEIQIVQLNKIAKENG